MFPAAQVVGFALARVEEVDLADAREMLAPTLSSFVTTARPWSDASLRGTANDFATEA